MLRAVAALLVLLLGLTLLYLPGLSGGFLFDDYPNIVFKEQVHAASLSPETLRRAAGSYRDGLGRPLSTVSFAMDHAAAGGLEPARFKRTNLAIHLVNALLVFLLVRRLLRLDTGRRWGPWAALLLAAAWAAHPLQVSTVLYVVQRMEMLAALFMLLALVAYLRGRQDQIAGRRGWPWLGVAACWSGLAVLAKESAVVLPLLLFAVEALLLRFRSAGGVSAALRGAWLAVLAAGFVVFAFWLLPRFGAAEGFAIRDYDGYQRVLTQMRVLPGYLLWSVLPLPGFLDFYYDAYPASRGWFSPATTALGALLLAGLLALAWRLRQRAPLAALGIVWFFACHALTSNWVNLELVFEHRNYLSLLGVLLAAADLLRRLPWGKLRPVLVGVALAALAAATLLRTATWGDPTLLALDLAERNPTSPRAATDLAEQYMHASGYDPEHRAYGLARAEFQRAADLPGASPLPEQGLILLATAAGQPVDPAWWAAIEDKLAHRRVGPQEVVAVTGLLQRHQEGLTLDAEALYRVLALLLVRRPDLPAHMAMALADLAMKDLDDPERTRAALREVARRSAGDPAYVRQVAGVLAADGHAEEAAWLLQAAERLAADADGS
ncbi:MAG: hypothetical protein KF823_07295 [Xanthomonadales bacterium]|nr:hypothetical protein [Xanthomonadales bacterium]